MLFVFLEVECVCVGVVCGGMDADVQTTLDFALHWHVRDRNPVSVALKNRGSVFNEIRGGDFGIFLGVELFSNKHRMNSGWNPTLSHVDPAVICTI